jgi:hypothetical protein
MVTDLSNKIPLCKNWDHVKLQSPAQPKTPAPIMLPPNIPIATANPIAFHIPTTVTACTNDSFIDDLIWVFLDTPHAVPLAIHVTSRPHMGTAEPVQCQGLLSAPKLKAEGTQVDLQIVLGWNLSTRLLLILLPDDKYEPCSADLTTIVVLKRTTFGELKSTIGRLNHVGYIIPLTCHFLTRLRLRIGKHRHKNQELSLNQAEIDDLDLWLDFLQQAQGGISLNHITTWMPSKICWSDLCPFGIGGFLLWG